MFYGVTKQNLNDNSLWASWIQSVRLKGKSLWEVKNPANASWAWRKILDGRKGMFISRIGNGEGTSLWYDYWLPNGGRIYDTQPARALGTTGLAWHATVADIIQNGEWLKPASSRYLGLHKLLSKIS